MILVKLFTLVVLILIFLQDYKERLVSWFLFPLAALFFGLLYYTESLPELFLASVVFNLILVSSVLGVVFIYTRLKLKTQISDVFGLGDVLMFLALAFTFATLSFLIIFVFSLVFALAVHLILKSSQRIKTVPLAGYMGLFFMCVYLGQWFGLIDGLYVL